MAARLSRVTISARRCAAGDRCQGVQYHTLDNDTLTLTADDGATLLFVRG